MIAATTDQSRDDVLRYAHLLERAAALTHALVLALEDAELGAIASARVQANRQKYALARSRKYSGGRARRRIVGRSWYRSRPKLGDLSDTGTFHSAVSLAGRLAEDLNSICELSAGRGSGIAYKHRRALRESRRTVQHLLRRLEGATASLFLDWTSSFVGNISPNLEACQRSVLLTLQQLDDRERFELEGRAPGQLVCAISELACRLLPAAHRSRYSQEFRAELFDLPRRARLLYALRQVRHAPSLRLGLTAQERS